jgi:hypothetical protein
VPRIETVCCSIRPRTVHRTPPGAWLRALAALLLVLGLGGIVSLPARAAGVEMTTFELARDEDSVRLSFATRFELPHAVEEALQKGVPLHFVAEADLYRSRWYWRDVRVARTTRTWRLAWQPLARSYRVSFGGLHQTFESLPDALTALRGAVRWKIADASQLEEGARHYVEFSYRLDTGQLPRPMQIGLAGQSDWALAVEQTEPLK